MVLEDEESGGRTQHILYICPLYLHLSVLLEASDMVSEDEEYGGNLLPFLNICRLYLNLSVLLKASDYILEDKRGSKNPGVHAVL